MKYEEIIKLLDAGYTREEILNMEEEPAAEDPAAEESASEDVKQAPDVVADTMKELKSMFADIKKEFTAMNIMNSRIDENVKTGDDVIANIINPPKYNKKEGK